MSLDIIIDAQRLSKYYGSARGIEGVDFSVARGEIFGFLGPNGAGKSTTIRLMLDLLRPTSGKLSLWGQPVAQATLDIRRRCGYLPGNFRPYADMTPRRFLQFAADLRRAEPSRLNELTYRFQFPAELMSRKIKHLSHGNQQKLGIIQAFFHDPELLILDEPTSGLDPLMQAAFYDLLNDVRSRGHTVFISSHNLPEVDKICQRAAVIREGKIVAIATLDELRKSRFRRLELTLSQPVPGFRFEGARLIEQDGLTYRFYIQGDIKGVLEQVRQLPVSDVILPEPDLQSVFLAYYRDAENE